MKTTSSFPRVLPRAAVLAAVPAWLAACGGEVGEPLGQEGAHEHGVADVSIVVDGAFATVVLSAPSGDLWGFESAPTTDEERAARGAALNLLERRLVEGLGFDPALGCRVAAVHWSGAAAPSEPARASDAPHAEAGGHEGHAADHDHESEDDHAHEGEDEHAHESGEEHAHESGEEHTAHEPGDGHDHADHAEGSDAVGEFDLECQRPLAGTRLRLSLSEVFEAVERVDLQVVSEERQFGRRVAARDTRIDL